MNFIKHLGQAVDELNEMSKPVCIWIETESARGTFKTTCKHIADFDQEIKDDLDFEFCPYCGNKLTIVYADKEEDDEGN